MRRGNSRKSVISKAGTYTGIGYFWDEHELSDYWHQTCSVRADVDLESEESLYAIERGLSQTICRAAKERGVSPHTLINLWLQEKIHRLNLGSRGG